MTDDDLRISDDPRGLTRGPELHITVDGREVRAHEGETIATALLATGVRTTRLTRVLRAPRGILCGTGGCHDCLVRVAGAGTVRACTTPVHDGMTVRSHWVEDAP